LLTLGMSAAALALLAGCGSSKSTHTSPTSASSPATASTPTPSTATTPLATGGALVSSKHAKLGTVLAGGSNRLTLYLFAADKGSSSSCTGACASAWPPLTTTGAPRASGAAVATKLATITRADGTKQVTYKGHPLYFFIRDKDASDAYGQAVKAFGGDWYVLAPSGKKIDTS
jgi:predicted lipoprotein with Yx(FWY)xxD motif